MKRLNPRRVKVHRNYSVGDAAMLFEVHKNTVHGWLASGLEPIDDRRPILILGKKLSSFLDARRKQRKRRCQNGQLYCVRCRAPKTPAGGVADYRPITSTSGNLRGSCPDCSTPMFRRVSLQKLAAVAGDLQVHLPQAQQRISDCSDPSLNCDLAQEADTHANTQS